MSGPARRPMLVLFIGLFAVLAAILTGVSLRLDDPMSTASLPAEDPYTHMALVREHVRDGRLEPLYEGGALYPPGMHAVIAAVWAYTGVGLEDLIRLGPALLGGLGILGMALLLWRHLGLTSGVVAAWAYAVVPEVIFRTTMMSPTALDLALLPFLLYAFLEMAKGRIAWSVVAAILVAFLAFAHPWLLLVLALMGGWFLLLAYLMPWGKTRGAPLDPKGVGALILVFAGATVASVWMRADGVFANIEWLRLDVVLPFLLVLSVIPLLIAWVLPKAAKWCVPRWGDRPVALWIGLLVMVALLPLLVELTRYAIVVGFPEHVRLEAMIGWPILILAGLTFLALPFVRSPVAIMGASLTLATYPFAIYNVFDSPFWPHRTVVFLAVGLVILVGVAAWAIETAARWLGAMMAQAGPRTATEAWWYDQYHPVPSGTHARSRSAPSSRTIPLRAGVPAYPATAEDYQGVPTRGQRPVKGKGPSSERTRSVRTSAQGHASRRAHPERRPIPRPWSPAPMPQTLMGFLLPLVLIALPLSGAVYASTPEPYAWYRLFDDCEHEVLIEVTGWVNDDERAFVAAASWQAKLVMVAHAEDAGRIWYAPHYVTVAPPREALADWAGGDGPPFYVIIDHHARHELGDPDLAAFHGPEWREVARGCTADPVLVYAYQR